MSIWDKLYYLFLVVIVVGGFGASLLIQSWTHMFDGWKF